MSVFINAMQTNDSRTANGAVTHSTSNSLCVDLFFVIGASRNNSQIVQQFLRAYSENPELATRILMWARDVRGGAGERSTFRRLLKQLVYKDVDVARAVMHKIPEIGRYDDLIALMDTPLESDALVLWANDIAKERNALAAKWLPREKSKNGFVFKRMAKQLGVSYRELRVFVSGVSDTVEQKMCAKKFDDIDFGKIPSIASARYQRAFGRNAYEKYTKYVQGLQDGTEKINAGAIFPHDVVRSCNTGNAVVANAQWQSLPDYIEGSTTNIIPVVDVSGSMGVPVGGNGNVTCKDVAIALGLYIAERTEGEFKDEFISFSSDPHFHKLTGDSLQERIRLMDRSGENMSTNITRCFKVLLERAIKANLERDELPDVMLILSDMEFDQAETSYASEKTNFEAIRSLYNRSGYQMPKLVFWNLNARAGNVPVKMGQANTALISGFSPSIMKSVLNGKIDPVSIMLDAVMSPRYAL